MMVIRGRVAELVDARDLKSLGAQAPSGFDSQPGHHRKPRSDMRDLILPNGAARRGSSSSIAGLFNQLLQQTMNLVKLCLDFRAVFQLGLEVLPHLTEFVINDGEDFSTLNLRSRWSWRSRSSSRTSRPTWSPFSRHRCSFYGYNFNRCASISRIRA